MLARLTMRPGIGSMAGLMDWLSNYEIVVGLSLSDFNYVGWQDDGCNGLAFFALGWLA